MVWNDIFYEFGAGSNVITKVAWTGHVLDTRSSASYSYGKIIVITIGCVTDDLNNNLSNEIIRQERIYTLLHEISHQIGAPDHYCYDEDSENCDNPTNDCWRCDRSVKVKPDCLMTYRMNDLEDILASGDLSSIYCSQCMSAAHDMGILTHLNDHHNYD